ncbi:MAG: D-tyrosyl-tRNA(Tyr) deacylase [Armatimonadetes bacterium]|nr:D-tyrosyl-tRNA(Tyr) deacylase [Armatimonadota bacterium]
MRAVIQRVRAASVAVDGCIVSSIERGLLVLVGVGLNDSESDAEWLADKTANLRIFEDGDGKMNLSLLEVGGEALVVSQFTLFGDARKGRRPSFSEAAPPDRADALYQVYVDAIRRLDARVQTGRFRARMLVNIENDGPVTILLDTDRRT